MNVRISIVCTILALAIGATAPAQEILELDLHTFKDKIRGGWAGQMVGVAYGYPVEFRALMETYEGDLPWDKDMIEASLSQDDLQIEMTFAEVMDEHGLDATMEQYGDAFSESTYMLWHANANARRNLQNGIKPPMSGHPKHNMHANDIDFQIEADFIGMMTPGMPQMSIELCDRVGHIMNYGDGVYGGMFVCGMYSAAYFETSVNKVVDAGLACLPKGSGYRAIIEDVISAHKQYPNDWRKGWRVISDKWDSSDPCPEGSLKPFNIDARLNGAFIAIGLLYGQGDFGKTIEIATRCGQDADCNPASAAGVLGLMYGFDALDKKWVGSIDKVADKKFVGTNYTFNEIVASTQKRALEAVRLSGGEVHDDRFVLPKQTPVPPALEQWNPGEPVQSIMHDDKAWTWTGDWEKFTPQRRVYAAPAGMVSHSAGNEAILEFTGTAISVDGYLTTNGAKADVYLDGKKAGTINSFIKPGTFDQDLWHTYGLEDGPHTLRIVTLDEADSRATKTSEEMDGMGYTDSQPLRFSIHRAIIFRSE
jgi:hypothetical protein